jgi:hypothetical protein
MDAIHRETGVPERGFDGRNEVIDGSRSQSEEVEIAGLALDLTPYDECRAAREGEVCSFLQPGDDLGDLTQELAQHVSATWR